MDRSSIETVDIDRFDTSSFEDDVREIQEVYAQFSRLGVPTLPSSRINAYRDAFESLKRAKDERRLDHPLAVRVLQTLVEFAQLKTIVRAAVRSAARAAWEGQLRRLIPGPSAPTPGSKHSPAHDFQFESFVAAVSELSGYEISFAEPDVVVRDDDCAFGIAAKRPGSSRRIEKNCRKAAKQIQQSGLPGVIALDMSFSVYPGQCVNTGDLADGLLFAKTAASDFVEKNYRMFLDVCRDGDVLGVLVCLHLPLLNFGHPEAPQLGTTVRWLLVPTCEVGDERVRWILRFAAKCELGLFGSRGKPEDGVTFTRSRRLAGA